MAVCHIQCWFHVDITEAIPCNGFFKNGCMEINQLMEDTDLKLSFC
jgi:hypothetical protein